MAHPLPAKPADAGRHVQLFFVAWSIVVLYDRAVRGSTDSAWSAAIVACCALLVANPRSVVCAGLLAGVHLTWYLQGYVERANVHWHVAAMVHLAILLSIGAELVRGRRVPQLADLHATLAPVLRAAFVILVFAGGFAKLNAGFLDPELSCAVALVEFQRTVFPLSLVPPWPWLDTAAIGLTLVAELGAPLLVLARVTRPLGLAITLGFFALVGVNPVNYLFEFAGEFVAMSVFFVAPATAAAGLAVVVPAARSFVPAVVLRSRWARFIAPLAMGAVTWDRGPLDLRDARLGLCRLSFVVGVGAIAAVLGIGARRRRGAPAAGLSVLPERGLALAVPLLLAAGEATPYLGLQHAPTMTMAGNLVISAAFSNHLVVSSVPTFEFNRVVRVVASSDPRLPRGTKQAWIAFSDWMARHPKAVVDYVVQGDHTLQHAPAAVGGVRPGRAFRSSPWPTVLRLDSQHIRLRSQRCGHSVSEADGG